MSTATLAYPRPSPDLRWLCGLLILLAGLYGVVQATSHAIANHAADAASVHDCLTESGTAEVWFNPTTGRFIELCQLDPESWGLRVVEEVRGVFQEITAFIEKGGYEAVERYLLNRGYMVLR